MQEKGPKMVFTGDIEQIDSPYLDEKSNGLSYLTDKMIGQDLFAHVNLVKGERSYLAELASHLLLVITELNFMDEVFINELHLYALTKGIIHEAIESVACGQACKIVMGL